MYAEAAREAVSASISALLPADYDDSIGIHSKVHS